MGQPSKICPLKSKFIDTNTGKEWTIFPDDAKLSLVERYTKWLVDRRSEI